MEGKLVVYKVMGLAVGWCLGLFYANNSMVRSWDPKWLQGFLNMLIGIFQRYVLVTNVSKSKAVTFHPGEIQSSMSEEVVGQQCTGRGAYR